MKVSESADQSASLEVEAERVQTELKEIRERRKVLATSIRSLKKRIKEIEASLPKLSLEIKGFDTTRKELSRLVPELQSQCELNSADEKAAGELRERLKDCDLDLKSCSEKAVILEREVEKLKTAIVEAGGTKLKKQENEVKKLKDEIKKTGKELAGAKVEIASNQKAAAKALESKRSLEQELVDCETAMEDTKQQLKSLESDAMRVSDDVERVKSLEEDARRSLHEKSTEYSNLQKCQSELKCTEIELVGKLDELNKQISHTESKITKWNSELEKLRNAERNCGLAELEESDDDESVVDADSDQSMTEAGDDTKEGKAKATCALPIFGDAELSEYNQDELKNVISSLETERNQMAKNANMGAIAEYRRKDAEYLARYVSHERTKVLKPHILCPRVAELDTVSGARNEARQVYENLRRQRLEMFMDGFSKITLKLKELYQMITLGGDAELELVDSLDPFSEGIMFSVRPPKKSWKNIVNLSGGEKTLSSLALVFALHHYKPTPLYVMDEIDAALDFKNVSIVANYIKERTRNAQFIIISLRNNMFELADRLVGIYKTDNCTKSISVNPHAFAVDAELPSPSLGQTPSGLSVRQQNLVDDHQSEPIDSARKQPSFASQQLGLENGVQHL